MQNSFGGTFPYHFLPYCVILLHMAPIYCHEIRPDISSVVFSVCHGNGSIFRTKYQLFSWISLGPLTMLLFWITSGTSAAAPSLPTLLCVHSFGQQTNNPLNHCSTCEKY